MRINDNKDVILRAYSIRAVLLILFTIKATFPFSFTTDFGAGIYWQGFPIGAQKFVASAGEGELLSRLVSQAENAWEDSVGREIWNIPASYQQVPASGNSIRWSNNFASDTGFNPSTTLAVTVRYRTGTFFTKFEIILNGENTALRENSGNILYQTILHEMGHVIGLDHSTMSNAVMYASLQGNESLSGDDIDGANAAIDENLRRQEIGFVSELAVSENEQSNALACGSIIMVNNDGPPGGGLLTVFLGFFLALILSHFKKNFPLTVKGLSRLL